MDIKTTTTELLKVSVLRPNEGQIPDVPANPRYITEQEFEALKASIQQDNLTGVLQMKVYNHEGEWIVLDGNMRLKALQELGLDEVQCLIVPQGTDAKTLRKIVISANSTFGNWDMDMIANEWDADEAREWGVDVPSMDTEDSTDDNDQQKEKGFSITYELAFNNDEEQEEWYKFLRDIKDHYNCDTISERVLCAIRDWYMMQNG